MIVTETQIKAEMDMFGYDRMTAKRAAETRILAQRLIRQQHRDQVLACLEHSIQSKKGA